MGNVTVSPYSFADECWEVVSVDLQARGIQGESAPPKGVTMIKVPQIWLEAELDDQWRAAYRLVVQNGRLVLGEVRVLPLEGNIFDRGDPYDYGGWSAKFKGVFASVPEGGLRIRLLRNVPAITAFLNQLQGGLLTSVERWSTGRPDRVIGKPKGLPSPGQAAGSVRDQAVRLHALVQRQRDNSPDNLRRVIVEALRKMHPEPTTGAKSRRGRKGRPPVFYARIARAYANLIDAKSPRPLQVIASRRLLTVEQVRAAVAKARRLGFLTVTTAGQKGGSLTPVGLRLLEPKPTPQKNKSKKPRTTKKRPKHGK